MASILATSGSNAKGKRKQHFAFMENAKSSKKEKTKPTIYGGSCKYFQQILCYDKKRFIMFFNALIF